MDQQLKSNLTSGRTWLRCLYMIFFAVCLQVASIVLWVLVVLQFLFALISGSDNENLRDFGQTLSKFIYQALSFLTFNSDDKPFPFADWPEVDEEPPLEGDIEVAREYESDIDTQYDSSTQTRDDVEPEDIPDRYYEPDDDSPEPPVDSPERDIDSPEPGTNSPEPSINSPERSVNSPERDENTPKLNDPDAGNPNTEHEHHSAITTGEADATAQPAENNPSVEEPTERKDSDR